MILYDASKALEKSSERKVTNYRTKIKKIK